MLPKDIDNISVCFSAGIGGDNAFENQLEPLGIRSFLLDSIEAHPKTLGSNQTFLPKWLGKKTEGDFIKLSDFVLQANLDGSECAMLKIDIEGSEWECLDVNDRDTLVRFQIIVIEFHNMSRMLEPKTFYEIYRPVLRFMANNFDVIDAHPNNCCGHWQVRDVYFPNILEITFHRKDRRKSEPVAAHIPHSLDAPNVLENPDVSIDWMRLINSRY